MLRADAIAQRYGGRPSEYLLGSLFAWQIDEAAAVLGSAADRKALAETPAAAPPAAPRTPQRMQLLGGMPIVTGIVDRE